MRFTGGDFAAGAVTAWVLFLILHQLALLVPLWGYGIAGLGYTLPWSAGALLVGSPLAYLLGWTLRREPSIAVHLVAFSLLGAIIGAGTTALALSMSPPWGLGIGFESALTPAVIVAASAVPAVALGWWTAARSALLDDKRSAPGSA